MALPNTFIPGGGCFRKSPEISTVKFTADLGGKIAFDAMGPEVKFRPI